MPRSLPTKTSIKLQPFSFILQPQELSALRKIAHKEGISVASVVRRAIYVVVDRVHPERRRLMVEHEVEVFLNTLSQRYPSSFLTSAKRSNFKKTAVKHLA